MSKTESLRCNRKRFFGRFRRFQAVPARPCRSSTELGSFLSRVSLCIYENYLKETTSLGHKHIRAKSKRRNSATTIMSKSELSYIFVTLPCTPAAGCCSAFYRLDLRFWTEERGALLLGFALTGGLYSKITISDRVGFSCVEFDGESPRSKFEHCDGHDQTDGRKWPKNLGWRRRGRYYAMQWCQA